jgi:hypothetical protein
MVLRLDSSDGKTKQGIAYAIDAFDYFHCSLTDDRRNIARELHGTSTVDITNTFNAASSHSFLGGLREVIERTLANSQGPFVFDYAIGTLDSCHCFLKDGRRRLIAHLPCI